MIHYWPSPTPKPPWPPPKGGDLVVYKCRTHFHVGHLVEYDDSWHNDGGGIEIKEQQ